ASAPPTAVLSESAAKACWPGQDPIGKRFQRSDEPGASWITVVGLVRDAKHRGRDPRHSSPMDVYYPLPQVPTTLLSLLVYTDQDSATLTPALRRMIKALDPELPVFEIAPLAERMQEEENENRFYALLMGIYATAAL